MESNVVTQIKTIYAVYFVMSSSLHWWWYVHWLNTSVCINKRTGLFCRALVCSTCPRPVRIWLCIVSHLWPLGGWAEWWNRRHRSKAEYVTFLRKKLEWTNYYIILQLWFDDLKKNNSLKIINSLMICPGFPQILKKYLIVFLFNNLRI